MKNMFTTPLLLAATAPISIAQISQLPEGITLDTVNPNLLATVRASLPEARAVGADFLDPDYNPVVTLSESAAVTVTFVDEGAGYRNSLAWVAFPQGSFDQLSKSDLDTNANNVVSLTELSAVEGLQYGLVFPNASRLNGGGLLETGHAITINNGQDFPQGTQVVFCLLQNAWKNGTVNGFNAALDTTVSLYSFDMINPEAPQEATVLIDSEAHSARHVAMLFGDASREQIIMGFEDLHRTDRYYNHWNIGSDEDFNDSVFIVTSTPAQAIAGTNIATAEQAFNPRPQGLFTNPDSCSIDTSNILSDELPEKTNVDAAFMNPNYTPTIVVSEATTLVLTFVGEGAIYQNSLGYITYANGALDNVTKQDADQDLDGNVEPWELSLLPGVEIGMVFAHASQAGYAGALQPGEAVIIGDREFQAGSNVDFFLVQDGWNDNGTVKDFNGDTASETISFYTIDRFNPEIQTDSKRHVAMMFSNDDRQSVLMGFEDLHRTDRFLNPALFESDEDFNDNVFCVSPLVIDAISTTNISVAGDTNCKADLNRDGEVDIRDLLEALAKAHTPTPSSNNSPRARLRELKQAFSLVEYLDDFLKPCN